MLVAGVKVATQTPPIRSGRRVVFVTLDDAPGPVDATFFEDAQGPYAATVFHSWLLVIRGEVRRTGPRGVSLRATGCWELTELYAAWQTGGLAAVAEAMAAPGEVTEAASRRCRGEPLVPSGDDPTARRKPGGLPVARGSCSGSRGIGSRGGSTAGGMGNRPGSPAGAGARERVPPVALRGHQAAGRRRGDRCTQGRARTASRPASCGTPVPAAPDEPSRRRRRDRTRARCARGSALSPPVRRLHRHG